MSPRPNEMVVLKDDYKKNMMEYLSEFPSSDIIDGLMKEDYFIFLGEIPNMLGNAAVVGQSGQLYVGFPIDNFRPMTEDEILNNQ